MNSRQSHLASCVSVLILACLPVLARANEDTLQSDRKPSEMLTNAERRFTVGQRYLNLPIKNGAPKRRVTLLVDGRPVVRNEIELAEGPADWWAPLDVNAWKGKVVTLQVDKLPEDSTALKAIEASDVIRGAENLYQEPLRGQFHFSSRRGWNNDPNGLVYFNNEYHLFYQHNPYGWNWGNMHWGHAVSRDLVHWEELGDKLLPDAMGQMFSGSAVVDRNNTSGFGKDGKPPLVLIYTAAGNLTTQCLAYSLDGRTFTKYEKNPVLPQIAVGNRDPKIIWHEPTKKWVMVLYVELDRRHTVYFFTSPNLKEWTEASVSVGGTVGKDGYLFECPDFFELPVDGDSSKRKWVLMGANTEYAIGTFDGTRFTPEYSNLTGHRGKGLYAPQTFSDIPQADGRRIQIGWFQTPTSGMPFNQSMTLPVELQLVTTSDGVRLQWSPAKELEVLRAKSHRIEPMRLEPSSANPLAAIEAELLELDVEFEPLAGSEVTFSVRGATIVYDTTKEEFVINGHHVPAPLREGKQQLRVFCDRAGLELFAGGGLTYVPIPFTPKANNRSLEITLKGNPVNITSLTVHELRSGWK